MSEAEESNSFDEWAKLELFGHNVQVGRVREVTLAGGNFLRIDVPKGDDYFTQFINPKSIYCITPIDENLARELAKQYRPEPIHQYELPSREVAEDDEF